MDLISDKAQCYGCSACAATCPQKCIAMRADEMGFFYPCVDEGRCINCRTCDAVCPVLQPVSLRGSTTPHGYAAVVQDNDIRQESSSGGVFTVLARYIIRQGGVVFGAAFAPNFRTVCHISVETEIELKKLRGSKYVQSEIGNTYSEAEELLRQGRKVLFTGTPCQIIGLKKYLTIKYDNLYLLTVACHGVPSPAVWSKYLNYLESRYKGRIACVSFRDKGKGWRNYRFVVCFSDGRYYAKKYSDDLYMRGFLRNCYLRPACYTCKAKNFNGCWDIMLADLWGVESICPAFNDDKGTSLVITSTGRGEKLLGEVESEMNIIGVDLQKAISLNPAIQFAAKGTLLKELFISEFDQRPIMVLLNKYCRDSLFKEFKRWIKNIV